MRLTEILALSLAFVFLIIGVYEIMAIGPASGYWAVMLSIALFFYYRYKKPKNSRNKGKD